MTSLLGVPRRLDAYVARITVGSFLVCFFFIVGLFVLVDLFDNLHARRVLTQFGQAYGRLPKNSAEMTDAASVFVAKAVDGLSLDDRVVPIRLALFADLAARAGSGDVQDWLGFYFKAPQTSQGAAVNDIFAQLEVVKATLEGWRHR